MEGQNDCATGGRHGALPLEGAIGRLAGGVGGRLVKVFNGYLAELRSDLARPAMNRRLLHRLALLSDAELRAIGLWRQDIRDAGATGIADVADFLVMRRDARRAMRR